MPLRAFFSISTYLSQQPNAARLVPAQNAALPSGRHAQEESAIHYRHALFYDEGTAGFMNGYFWLINLRHSWPTTSYMLRFIIGSII